VQRHPELSDEIAQHKRAKVELESAKTREAQSPKSEFLANMSTESEPHNASWG